MTFDEQHGWVERGTPGVHSGAVVRDVIAEVAALDRIRAHRPYDMDLAARRYAHVRYYGGTARAARYAPGEPAPAHLYAGFDVGQDSATAMTTYAVEGDTLRIVHTARMPLRAQTVNVTMAIGGE